MQHHRTRERTGKRARLSVSLLERIQPDAAGVDCGQNSHFVAVPPERDPQPVREFRTFTAELYQLADWLKQCQVKTVAMESTGVYWIPLYEILEERGFVERRADENDRRINRVFCTQKGNHVLDRMAKIGMDMNAKIMRGISLQRQHMLTVTLHEMKENLIALDTVPGSKPKSRA